jgi:ABC-type branched-subunit amino acid transport system permease subunit
MSYYASLLPLACIYGILVLGLNFQFGLTGILNFTYITFVAIGAYVSGVLTLGMPGQQQTYILGAHVAFPSISSPGFGGRYSWTGHQLHHLAPPP